MTRLRDAQGKFLPNKTTKKKGKAAKFKNHIAIVLDCSYSMRTIAAETAATYDSLVDTIKQQARQGDQETTVSLVTFDDLVRVVYTAVPVCDVKPLGGSYRADGNTALYDGTGATIELLQQLPDAGSQEVSFLIMVITDGEENRSTRYNKHKLCKLISEVEADGRWTVTFQVPPGKAQALRQLLGVAAENVREWETTGKGIREAGDAAQRGVAHYFTARAAGQKKLDAFYADLSKVSTTKVKRNLQDVSGQYKLYVVDKECPIKEFVESKTKREYVIGSTFYELTKPETVQASKDVLVVERGNEKKVYGGASARELLGLPQGESARLTPANLGKWRPCVKSTSVNRKLVRGTIVLVDRTKIANDQPTWDHTAVK